MPKKWLQLIRRDDADAPVVFGLSSESRGRFQNPPTAFVLQSSTSDGRQVHDPVVMITQPFDAASKTLNPASCA
jgi:hypothetical protein